jgi:NAD(P)H-nitrite reductase large subunit
LHLARDEVLPFDRLVIATGANLYAPLEGHELKAVYNFKSLSAAEKLIKRVRKGKVNTALVVGAGFIGVEIALLLQDLGVQVTLLEAEDRLIPAILEPETAAVALRAVQDRGVDVRLGTRVESFRGWHKAHGVELASGERLAADACIAATGVKPNVEWLEHSEVETRWGVVVDDFLRTALSGVYAAGDVAETRDRQGGEPYVHAIFPNAVAQGHVVASALLGDEIPYEGSDSMNSLKHLGVEIIAAGRHDSSDSLCLRRSGSLRKLFLDDGRIVGYSLVGDIRAAGVYRALMLKGTDVTPFRGRLLDPRPGAAWLAAAAA